MASAIPTAPALAPAEADLGVQPNASGFTHPNKKNMVEQGDLQLSGSSAPPDSPSTAPEPASRRSNSGIGTQAVTMNQPDDAPHHSEHQSSSAGIPSTDGAAFSKSETSVRTPPAKASRFGLKLRSLTAPLTPTQRNDAPKSEISGETTECESAGACTHPLHPPAANLARQASSNDPTANGGKTSSMNGQRHSSPMEPQEATVSTASNGHLVQQDSNVVVGDHGLSTPWDGHTAQESSAPGELDTSTKRHNLRKRASAWGHSARHQSFNAPRRQSTHADPDSTRPSHFRRITTIGGAGLLSGSTTAPSPWRAKSEVGAQKWRQLKAGLKLMGQRKREASKLDQLKSAELMAEILAGSPAALILASSFQRDEGQKRKIPVLLEQLKIRITDSQRRQDSAGDRHVLFRVELEYGSGLMRMKWVIWRTLKDFVNLHLRYKVQSGRLKSALHKNPDGDDRDQRLPRFPRSAFPYLRSARGLDNEAWESEDEAQENDAESQRRGTAGQHFLKAKKIRPSMHRARQSSTGGYGELDIASPMTEVSNALDTSNGNAAQKGGGYADRQRRKLEQYLQELIRYLFFRPGSNRLCRFLELSALGIRLAAEGGFHGKEGTLILRTGKGVDFRRAWTPAYLYRRHKPMWFLVRHSYIVCVDSPEEMNIYDVYLVDGDFEVQAKRKRVRDQKSAKDMAKTAKQSARHPQHHVLRFSNAERKTKLLAKNERQLIQFEDSLRLMASNTIWSKTHRFGSFAPVREKVFAQWLVDGRDYMWNVSRAISMAQDVIYIHDWWLSPELYLRRPAAISHKWRLDRLLQKKAREGVKVFVIMYRNINSAIPIDSEYSKFSLLDLHPNVFVQRSPNQVRQNVFFWAHHEKICIVDHTIAFCGGVDLCFGRWDTPRHNCVDDKPTGFEPSDLPKDADHCQLFPGKDYSNPRVLDFFDLANPYDEMYDRSHTARMPWHDIGMQIVGQPARDLTRHFVQRWNYILRQRKPSRPTPFLLPPPDFNPGDLETLGLDGTCSVQMLRSACEWSIGTPGKVEHSIMNAYCKLIETSQHFVYIENQFFISSCVNDEAKIRNKIGDALVERIIRAHRLKEAWRAIVVIPLMPGFPNTVDNQDGTSVRLIMQCQFRSICRGPTSVFGRLRAEGIRPQEYIEFYSLRSWGKAGPSKALVTEQLYIHAKCMVVDDRWAIIGSANINERSMLGERDSEVAAVVWDNDMLDSTMAGRDYRVGRFPHTLRMRLMREHLGLDVDEILHEAHEDQIFDDVSAKGEDELEDEVDPSITSAENRATEEALIESQHQVQDDLMAKSSEFHSFNHDVDWSQRDNQHIRTRKKITSDSRVTGNAEHRKDVEGFGFDGMHHFEGELSSLGRDSIVLRGDREILLNDTAAEGIGTLARPAQGRKAVIHHDDVREAEDVEAVPQRTSTLPTTTTSRTAKNLASTPTSQLPSRPPTDDSNIGGPGSRSTNSASSSARPGSSTDTMRHPVITKDCMRDPLNNGFFRGTWHTTAENNTTLFREVFRCMPDSNVTTWEQYNDATKYGEDFAHSMGVSPTTETMHEHPQADTGPPGHGTSVVASPSEGLKRRLSAALTPNRPTTAKSTDARDDEPAAQSKPIRESVLAADQAGTGDQPRLLPQLDGTLNEYTPAEDETTKEKSNSSADGPSTTNEDDAARRRVRATSKPNSAQQAPVKSKAEAEALITQVQGHLVLFPYDWLLDEERGGKWLYSVDQMAPLEIYD